MHGVGLLGMGAGMWIFWVLLIAAIVWGAIVLGRRADRPDYGMSGSMDSLEILRKRYARGELTTREYEERRKVLQED